MNNVLHDLLRKIPNSVLSKDSKNIEVRCPFCGDNKKNPESKHLSISTSPPFQYSCWICKTSGILNGDLLASLGITDVSVVDLVTKEITEWQKTNLATIQGATNVKYTNTLPDENIFKSCRVKEKTAYFNKRFHTNFTPTELITRFKTVFSLDNYCKTNRKNIYMGEKTKAMLESDYIGFVSADGHYIIMRDITGNNELRYYNLKTSGQIALGSKSYTLPARVDQMNMEATLIITEGVFDIIGVSLAFGEKYKNKPNVIYAAVCGKNYDSIIYKFAKLGFYNMSVEIYSDSDVDMKFYKELQQKCFVLNDRPINVYYNTINKDYGIAKEEIVLEKYILSGGDESEY